MIDWAAYRQEGISDLLMQYQAVADHPTAPDPLPPDEVCLTGIRELYLAKWHIFSDRHKSMENAFKEWQTAEANRKAKEAELELARLSPQAPTTVLTEWDGKGPCPTCKREPLDPETVAARQRGLKWLAEHGDE